MKLIQCVTDNDYIVWQLYVQMVNFREMGIEQDAIILVATEDPREEMKRFAAWTKASVYYYRDDRAERNYFSGFRPNLLKKFFQRPDAPKVYLYHDQDIIFLKKPDLAELEKGEACYVAAAARSYLWADYVQAFKQYDHLSDMAKIVGIDVADILKYDQDKQTGGAQYVLKDLGYDFWNKVDHDVELIHRKITLDTLEDERNGVYHIQVWCADMWAVLYNLCYFKKDIQQHAMIDFAWPWEPVSSPHYIMHNAGIDHSNEMHPEQQFNRRYFNKSRYTHKDAPFGETHDYVSKEIVQSKYVELFPTAKKAMSSMNERKLLAVLCTTNKINAQLLQQVIQCIKRAADLTKQIKVEVVCVSWEPIEGIPFENLVTPFRNLDWLNYIFQIKEAILTHQSHIVTILEHDVLYPEDWFDRIASSWDNNKYGVWMDDYIGMNESGYLAVKERHQPMSMMSAASFYLSGVLDKKVNECIRRIHEPDGYQTKYGWACVEPDNKTDFKIVEYSGIRPAVHVNMNHQGEWGTGQEGRNHHFTSHCEVCYEADSGGVISHEYWGDYRAWFPAQPARETITAKPVEMPTEKQLTKKGTVTIHEAEPPKKKAHKTTKPKEGITKRAAPPPKKAAPKKGVVKKAAVKKSHTKTSKKR